MSKKKARQPDRAKKGPAASDTKVVKVKFWRRCVAEITLAVPEKTTKGGLAEILEAFESEQELDGIPWYVESDAGDYLQVVTCETIKCDKAEAFLLATRDGDQWKFDQKHGGGNSK